MSNLHAKQLLAGSRRTGLFRYNWTTGYGSTRAGYIKYNPAKYCHYYEVPTKWNAVITAKAAVFADNSHTDNVRYHPATAHKVHIHNTMYAFLTITVNSKHRTATGKQPHHFFNGVPTGPKDH